MARVVEKLSIYIDSKDRATGTNENFEIKLASRVSRVQSIEIVSVEIPFTFYIINATNNNIRFNNGTTTYNAAIPAGNYDAVTFAGTIQTAMNAAMAGFTVTYSVPTYKLTFANATPFQVTLTGTTCAAIIGVTADSTLSTAFTGQSSINLSGPNYVFIRSTKLMRGKTNRSLFAGNPSDILYKMVVSTGPGTTLIDKNLYPNNPVTYGTRQVIDDFDLTLIDPDGNVLDLNGQRWSITLVADLS